MTDIVEVASGSVEIIEVESGSVEIVETADILNPSVKDRE